MKGYTLEFYFKALLLNEVSNSLLKELVSFMYMMYMYLCEYISLCVDIPRYQKSVSYSLDLEL